jgi:glycosyltransferase involved in cell wall biosynthesis
MRVLVDAMGAPANSGGMNLYARELIRAWAEAFPEDEITVIGGEWVTDFFSTNQNVVTIARRGRGVISRAWVQIVGSGVVAHRRKSDALLSLSPIVSPLFPRSRRAAVVHDWRHLRRPDEFRRGQRLYRLLWRWSIRGAGTTIVISKKTAAETSHYARPRRMVVVENGGDHPRHWEPVMGRSEPPLVLTYGHFVNKRPEPVLEAIGLLRATGVDVRVCVLGAKGRYRDDLRALAKEYGVDDAVEFPGYVSEEEYQRLLQRAAVLVLNSSDEGFGLPVSEARYFGIPAVVSADSGLAVIHGDSVLVSEPRPDALASAIRKGLTLPSSSVLPPSTWTHCASRVREALNDSG